MTAPPVLGRPLMSAHNASARLWATAALIGVPVAWVAGVGWWLPLHLALLGAASQAIVGGQLMFSATLGMSREPSRRAVVVQLALFNAAAALVVAGRLWGVSTGIGLGAVVFVLAVGWVMWQVEGLWRRSLNPRFRATRTFYRLAGTSVLVGAAIGGALGAGMVHDPAPYLRLRDVHMTLNVLGWAGLTTVGTAVTLLPTILHAGAPKPGPAAAIPWSMFAGLIVHAAGALAGLGWVRSLGMVSYAAGLAGFGAFLKRILSAPRRRKVPAAALHLVASLGWLAGTTVGLAVFSASGDEAALREVVLVGGAAGFVFQALLGAWSFMLPSMRGPVPERRRRELVAMEIGGRVQVLAYNAGLVAVLLAMFGVRGAAPAGIVVAWSAAAWVLVKCWAFPLLAVSPHVHDRAALWWAVPDGAAPSTARPARNVDVTAP